MLLKFTANVILARRTDLLRTENRLNLADFTTTRTHVPATLIVQGEFGDLDTFLDTLDDYLPNDATIDDYGEEGARRHEGGLSMNRSRYTVPVAFMVHPADVEDIVKSLRAHHLVVGHRIADRDDFRQDPRFLDNADEFFASEQGDYATILVVDIVWDEVVDDWVDRDLLEEADHLPVFCYPAEGV